MHVGPNAVKYLLYSRSINAYLFATSKALLFVLQAINLLALPPSLKLIERLNNFTEAAITLINLLKINYS